MYFQVTLAFSLFLRHLITEQNFTAVLQTKNQLTKLLMILFVDSSLSTQKYQRSVPLLLCFGFVNALDNQ